MNSSFQQILNPYGRLRSGCYEIRFKPNRPYWSDEDNPADRELGVEVYAGTVRVVHYDNTGGKELKARRGDKEEWGSVIYVSGDLYAETGHRGLSSWGNIPLFRPQDYRFYLLANCVTETGSDTFELEMESHELRPNGDWESQGRVVLRLAWAEPVGEAISPFDFLEGEVVDEYGVSIGFVNLRWVSSYLRAAIVELDRVTDVRIPFNNFDYVEFAKVPFSDRCTWQKVMGECGWAIDLELSDRPAESPHKVWTESELQVAIPSMREDSVSEYAWRYQIFCVGKLEDGGRGYAFNSRGVTPGGELYGNVVLASRSELAEMDGRLLEETPCYFRTAVHEFGHALGLKHNFETCGFMATTDAIFQEVERLNNQRQDRGKNLATFENTVQWSFAESDLQRLRHYPDPIVRPGKACGDFCLPGIDGFRIVPLVGGSSRGPDVPNLDFALNACEKSVPLGAPVRIECQLTNRSAKTQKVPRLGMKGGNLSGFVTSGSGSTRQFYSLAEGVDTLAQVSLEPGGTLRGYLTLLSGPDGPLFPSPGVYTVRVQILIHYDRVTYSSEAKVQVSVDPWVNERHLAVAKRLLRAPNALISFAIDGYAASDGNQAINLALSNPVLRPYYEVVRLKRLFFNMGFVRGSLSQALDVLSGHSSLRWPKTPNREEKAKSRNLNGVPVLTPSEVASLVSCIERSRGFLNSGKAGAGKWFVDPYMEVEVRVIGARIALGRMDKGLLRVLEANADPKRKANFLKSFHKKAAQELVQHMLSDLLGVDLDAASLLAESLTYKNPDLDRILHQFCRQPKNEEAASKLIQELSYVGLSIDELKVIKSTFLRAAEVGKSHVIPAVFRQAGEVLISTCCQGGAKTGPVSKAYAKTLSNCLREAGWTTPYSVIP